MQHPSQVPRIGRYSDIPQRSQKEKAVMAVWEILQPNLKSTKSKHIKATYDLYYIYIYIQALPPPPPPHPHGMGPIYCPYMISSPSLPVVWWGCGTVPLPPCGVVGAWYCPPPPLWCGGGVVWYVGYVWCVWSVWYGMPGKYGMFGMYGRYAMYGMNGCYCMDGKYGM